MKLKFAFRGKDQWAKPFYDLLQGRRDEIILRKPDQLAHVTDAAQRAKEVPEADLEKLDQLLRILDSKVGQAGTKAQIKPHFDADGEFEKIQLIVKWGGEVRYRSLSFRILC